MREIDLQTWDRRDHFLTFRGFHQPHFGLCANVDMTLFYPFVKHEGIRFTTALVYVLSRAANAIPSFRYRLRDGVVVEHEVVHPSITVLVEGDLFGFCYIDYADPFTAFEARTEEAMAEAQAYPTLADEPGRDDLLFMTAIPWVAFTSFLHPLPTTPSDSFPRFAWGKRIEEGKKIAMPLGVQGHHALMDGFHVGRFYAEVQDYLNHPEAVLERV